MSGEVYTGTKFRTLYISHEPPEDNHLSELTAWSHRLAELGVLATAMGNVSFRTLGGFIISPTRTDPHTITPRQFVEVLAVDVATRTLQVRGAAEPSSESMLHSAIYRARKDVQAIFHGHDSRVLAGADKLQIPVTLREQSYGTPALVDEALAIAVGCDVFVMRNHGFVVLGVTLAEAGGRVEGLLQRL